MPIHDKSGTQNAKGIFLEKNEKMSNVGKASKCQVKVPEMEARLANLRNHKKLMGLELCKQERKCYGGRLQRHTRARSCRRMVFNSGEL